MDASLRDQVAGALLSRMPRGSELDRLLQELPRDSHWDFLLVVLKELAADGDAAGGFPRALRNAAQWLRSRQGPGRAANMISRLEVALKLRRPSLALYDHTLHIIGGGQKYGLTLVDALKEAFDITILTHRPMEPASIRDWYGLDLSGCRYQTVDLPEFSGSGAHIDPAKITRGMENPFHRVSRLSGGYDVFVNNSMNEMVFPLAGISAMVCHFPERRPAAYFYADRYDAVIYNSEYTAGWIEKKWKFRPHVHIYPPVDMPPAEPPGEKDPIILSVARFEQGGSKRQKEMVQAFLTLRRRFPDETRDWHLVLAGGSPENNPYLEDLKREIRATGDTHIRLRVNISSAELHDLYLRASVFWHLCGLHQTDPALVEHFGMTIGEAMQNGIVPVVFDGGGQREIVEPGKTGFRVRTLEELIRHTRRLIREPDTRRRCGLAALEASRRFDRPRFTREVREFFLGRLENYIDPKIP